MMAKEEAAIRTVPAWYVLFLVGTMIVAQFNLWSAPSVQTSAGIWGSDWTGACRSSIVFHLAFCGIFYWLMSWPSRHPDQRIGRDETDESSTSTLAVKSNADPCGRDCSTLSFIVTCAFTSFLTLGTALDCSETLSNTAGNASFVCFAMFWTFFLVYVAQAWYLARREEEHHLQGTPFFVKIGAVLLIVACVAAWIAVLGLLHTRARIRDETLPFVSSSYASSGITTDTGGGPGLLLNATRAESSNSRISDAAYSGWAVVKSYEILADDPNSLICTSGRVQVELTTGWGGSWACPNTGDGADCEATVITEMRCGGYCGFYESNQTLAECAQERYSDDYSNYDSSTEPDFSNMYGMTFVYSNCDSCEAYTTSWMRNQSNKMLSTLHAAFLVLGMAIGLTATIAALVYRVLTLKRIDQSAVSSSGFLT
jgi:hypothetical protein